MLLNGALLF
ncbi:hypothetical protein LINPERHAP1_LOCUS8745 [Linum perenne]